MDELEQIEKKWLRLSEKLERAWKSQDDPQRFETLLEKETFKKDP